MSLNSRPILVLACLALAALACTIELTGSLEPTAVPPSGVSAADPPMVVIPAGEFQMGSDPDAALAECKKSGDNCEREWFVDEAPKHNVFLDAYSIDVYEVTNARYAECVKAGRCYPPDKPRSSSRDSYYKNLDYAYYPVIYVDWLDARAYCQWRGGDLPSEAQWEKAARGGLAGMHYPWGNEVPTCERANFSTADEACLGDTARVGSSPANGYGLYDMAGNVWEWTRDWYDSQFYKSTLLQNPLGPDNGNARIVRGGSWQSQPVYLRVALRGKLDPSNAEQVLGFRCVR